MTPSEIRALLNARPFRPFRVVTPDGTAYEVRHPDIVVPTVPSLLIGHPSDEPGAARNIEIVSMRQALRFEMIDPPGAGPEGNRE